MKSLLVLSTLQFAYSLELVAHRPSSNTWKRTLCGSPSGAHPAIPAGDYTLGVDYPGNDMPPCGRNGCVLAKTDNHLVCEGKCNATKGCAAYIFADASCSGAAGPICWLKSNVENPSKNKCRNSRILGQPAGGQADIPSKWAADVSADKTPLVAYPRPQMVRGKAASLKELRDVGDANTWTNLNGLWEWEPATSNTPTFGKPLNGSILVPFPVESCLSGVAPASSAAIVMEMWYRLTFDAKDAGTTDARTLLHFGAVDWQSAVYLNGKFLGNHTGGYDGFSFDVTDALKATDNELLVYAFDPSDHGHQPNGKQRISAIDRPGGDTYTPSSGIWQTVWMEAVPAGYISALKINQASTTELDVMATTVGGSSPVTFTVMTGGKAVASGTAASGDHLTLKIPDAHLWSTTDPFLYDLKVSYGADSVVSYFGLRTFVLGPGPNKAMRPLLNGNFTFLAGFLDQSWWPDGQYTAPTDEALASDIQAVPMFGLNMIRLHQKVNPERWYYHADTIGVVVFQDMVQKYGGASAETVPLFVEDFKAMVAGRSNHPCIVQWETFNEGDCYRVFNTKPYDVAGIVALAKQLDPTRLVDTDSGGGANNMHIGDVNDIHSYPWPGNPDNSATQYAMIGEFGGIGAFVEGKEWKPRSCHTYLHVDTPAQEAATYIKMAAEIQGRVDHVSASVYTQTTDLELECDGFLNYDRTNKFSAEDTEAIKKANQAIIDAASAL